MTTKQKQALLAYLGYYDGAIDGIWGEKSRRASTDFQRAYMDIVDDTFPDAAEQRIIAVISTGEQPSGRVETDPGDDWWKDIRYFKRVEFRCPCGRCGGFPVEPAQSLVRLADQIREHFGAPATVSSGVRCQKHNDELPGSVPNSYHVKGMAMDFCVEGVSSERLLAYVKRLPAGYAYRIDGSFVHMDIRG